LKDRLEAKSSRWGAADGKVVEYRENIPDIKVQLDAMSGAKCDIVEQNAVQELRANTEEA
jgi:hypothetical protein